MSQFNKSCFTLQRLNFRPCVFAYLEWFIICPQGHVQEICIRFHREFPIKNMYYQSAASHWSFSSLSQLFRVERREVFIASSSSGDGQDFFFFNKKICIYIYIKKTKQKQKTLSKGTEKIEESYTIVMPVFSILSLYRFYHLVLYQGSWILQKIVNHHG